MDFEHRHDELLKALGVRHACEVGVYVPRESKILGLALKGLRCTFVEPEAGAFSQLGEATGHQPNRLTRKSSALKLSSLRKSMNRCRPKRIVGCTLSLKISL